MKFLYLIFFLLFNISIVLYAADYKVTLMGTESLPVPINCTVEWDVKGINNKGQVYGLYRKNEPFKDQKTSIYIYDYKGGIYFIESDKYSFFSSCMANNNGQMIGEWSGKPNIFIYSKTLGIRPLDFSNVFDKYKTSNDTNNHITPVAFNDLGQMIGTSYMHSRGEEPLLWDNGVISEMGKGSEFATNFESQGYHVFEIQILSINNKGELAGYFCYGRYNEKQKKYVKSGYKTFFWDGNLHVLDLASEARPPQVLKVNNCGVLLIRESIVDYFNDRVTEMTHLWDVDNGLLTISDFYGTDINDSSTVLGFKKEHICCRDFNSVPAIWKNGQCITIAELLNVPHLGDIAPPYSDQYLVERLHPESFVGINNKGQIACLGTVWGEQHPCILEPVSE